MIRVVSRLRAIGGDPTKLTATHNIVSQSLMGEVERPGDFNQVGINGEDIL